MDIEKTKEEESELVHICFPKNFIDAMNDLNPLIQKINESDLMESEDIDGIENSAIFYKSFFLNHNEMEISKRIMLTIAITNYMIFKVEPTYLTGVEKTIFLSNKQGI